MSDAMSASGTKRTLACALHMSAFGGKADGISIPSMSGKKLIKALCDLAHKLFA